jgi:hypothetical protein
MGLLPLTDTQLIVTRQTPITLWYQAFITPVKRDTWLIGGPAAPLRTPCFFCSLREPPRFARPHPPHLKTVDHRMRTHYFLRPTDICRVTINSRQTHVVSSFFSFLSLAFVSCCSRDISIAYTAAWVLTLSFKPLFFIVLHFFFSLIAR